MRHVYNMTVSTPARKPHNTIIKSEDKAVKITLDTKI